MKMQINLISADKKAFIKQLRIYTLVKHISYVLGSFVVISLVIFYFTNLLLQNQLDSLTIQIQNEKLTIEQGKVASTEEAISQLNTQLSQAKIIQDQYIFWLPILQNYLDQVPTTVKISSFRFSVPNNSFHMSGRADSGDDLLTLEERLKKYQLLTNVTSSLSSITQKNNIPFEISAQLSPSLNDKKADNN